jgi:hypothetical protein
MSWVAVGVTAVSVVSGFVGAKKAGKAAKAQAKEEARITELTTDERIRQLGKEERSLYGVTLANYTGGGVLTSFGTTSQEANPLMESAKSVTAEQASEFEYERQITQEVGASNVQQALAGGRDVASQYKFNAITSGTGSVVNMLNAYRAG